MARASSVRSMRPAPARVAASSSRLSATRASPLAWRAMAARASSSAAIPADPRPRSGSSSARRRMAAVSSVASGCSTKTFERDSRAALTSNEGFSVVAPISTMSPASTRGRKASCCALLKRWISSTKRIVRRPSSRRAASASAITALISLMPARTALKAMKWARVTVAIRRAMVVLPVPGGPQRMIDCSVSRSMAARNGRSGASSSRWPTSSSKVRGRIRSASGAPAAGRSGAFDSNRWPDFIRPSVAGGLRTRSRQPPPRR